MEKTLFLKKELSENIAKPNDLWQTLKSRGLPNKKNSPSTIFLKNKNDLLVDSLSVSENLVLKLPKLLNNFGLQSVSNYYKNCNVMERFLFVRIESDRVFKIIKNFDESKAPDMIFQESF